MVRIQSEIKRAILRSLWRAAQSAALPLLTALEGFQNTGWSTLQSGQILVSGSGAGYSSSLKVPNVATDQITQENFLALSEAFLNVYYQAVFDLLKSASPSDTTEAIYALMQAGSYSLTDQQIFASMIESDYMQGIREQLGDWTGLNIPSLGGIPSAA
jgi:hypothetical protein